MKYAIEILKARLTEEERWRRYDVTWLGEAKSLKERGVMTQRIADRSDVIGDIEDAIEKLSEE